MAWHTLADPDRKVWGLRMTVVAHKASDRMYAGDSYTRYVDRDVVVVVFFRRTGFQFVPCPDSCPGYKPGFLRYRLDSGLTRQT